MSENQSETIHTPQTSILKTGSCNCGKLMFEVSEKPLFTVLCHCRMCRKGTGAPVSLVVAVPPNGFKWKTKTGFTTDQLLKIVPFSEKFNGMYCAECNGFVAQHLTGGPLISTMGCCYDEMKNAFCPGEEVVKKDTFFQPICHFNYENRVIDIPDKLPKFMDFSAPFGSNRMFTEEEEK